MATISDEKLKEIFEKVFGLKCYDFENHAFIDADKTTGKPFGLEEKYMALLLLKAARTEEGSHILSQLSLEQPVDLIFDSSQKDVATGWSAGHTVAITNKDRDINLNVSTLMHELTHEVQAQSGSNESELATEQDRFMVNKMKEAEARLETAIVYTQVCTNQLQIDGKNPIANEASSQLLDDCAQYMTLRKQGKTPEEIRETMLKSFFSDEVWNTNYNEQATEFAYSKYDRKRSSFRHGKSAEEVMAVFMERNGLSKETGNYFLSPENISNYPKDKILAKSTEEHSGAGVSLVGIYEGGVRICQEIRNEEGKVLQSSRYNRDGVMMESKEYGLDGELKSQTTYLDSGKICAVYNNGQLENEVYYNNKDEVIEIRNAKGEFVADGVSLAPVKEQGMELFSEIRTSQLENKPINMEGFTQKAEAVIHDTYALFTPTVAKTVAEEVLRQNEALKKGKLQISAEEAERLQRLAADIKEMAPEACLLMEQKIVQNSYNAPVEQEERPAEKEEMFSETVKKPTEQVEEAARPVENTEERPAAGKEENPFTQGMEVWGKIYAGRPFEIENFAYKAEIVIKNAHGDFYPDMIETVAKGVLKREVSVQRGEIEVSAEEAQALASLAQDVRHKMPALAESMDKELGLLPQQEAQAEAPARAPAAEPAVKAPEAEAPARAPAAEPAVKAPEAEAPAWAPATEPAVKAPEAEAPAPTPAAEPAVQAPEANVKDAAVKNSSQAEPQTKLQEDKRSSEEIILDTLLEKGDLTKAQENKLIQIATEIEINRLRFQGKNNFAEQMIDKIAQSNLFTEKQKSIALDAAIVSEKKEHKQQNPNMALLAKQARMGR